MEEGTELEGENVSFRSIWWREFSLKSILLADCLFYFEIKISKLKQYVT